MTIVLASVVARWELRPVSPGPVRPVPTFSLTLGELRMSLRDRVPQSVAPTAGGRATHQPPQDARS